MNTERQIYKCPCSRTHERGGFKTEEKSQFGAAWEH